MTQEHYFTEDPQVPFKPRELRLLFAGRILTLRTSRGVFGSEGLDPGTALLVENLVLQGNETLLDMGCGWGPIGIAAALSLPKGRVLMVDINKRAVMLSKHNVHAADLANAEVRAGNLFEPVGTERFDVIATNPPYHAGREAVLRLIDESSEHLNPGGKLVMVGKGSQGILYYQRYLEGKWGQVEVLARRSGYRVLSATLIGDKGEPKPS